MDIKVVNINKKYKSKKEKVLNNVCFEAVSGECIGVLGANGCGKTTLLSILSGVLNADSGTFLMDGQSIIKKRKMIERNIGYVPQGNPLMEELSAKDNLRLWYCDSVLNLKEELNNGVLKMLGIDQFLNVRVSKMSGGMKKRLSIGCAVSNNPNILILDEPGASLDVVCKNQIEEYLRNFKEKGGIIIIATHEEREIALCDRTYILKNGELSAYQYKDMKGLMREIG